MRILHKNNQMCITNIKINTKVRTYLQSLWNQRRKLHYLQLNIGKEICRKKMYKKFKYKLIVLTKRLVE